MTTLTATPTRTVRPVPWRRLAWVAWRRHRATLVGAGAVFAVLGIYLIVTGHEARSAYAAIAACTPPDSTRCRFLDDNFHNRFGQSGLLDTVLILLPGLIGAFAGTPLLARELETGTFRYAWTQGVGRMRWAVTVLLPGAIGVAVLFVGFGAIVRWHDQPLLDYGIMARLQPSSFPVTGIAVGGWALIGFALGVLAGLVWRRVLPALGTAFAIWFGLALVTAHTLRPNYEQALRTTNLNLSNRDLFISQWWSKGGARVSDAALNQALQAGGVSDQIGGGVNRVHVDPGSGNVDPITYLTQHGYRQITSYQPDHRFWTFQWIEFGWLVALSAVLIGAALWLLRRRPA